MSEELSQSYKDFYAVPLGQHAAIYCKDLRQFIELANAPLNALDRAFIPDAMRPTLIMQNAETGYWNMVASRENTFGARWHLPRASLRSALASVEKLNFEAAPAPNFLRFYDLATACILDIGDLMDDLRECYYWAVTPPERRDFSIEALQSRRWGDRQFHECWNHEIAGVSLIDIDLASLWIRGGFFESGVGVIRDAILSGVAHNDRAEIERLQATVSARENAEASLSQLLRLEFATPEDFARHFTLELNRPLSKPVQGQGIRHHLRENIGPRLITGTDKTYATVCTNGTGTNWRVPNCLIRDVYNKLKPCLRSPLQIDLTAF